ncbi:MAG: hypothetical protein ILO68_08525, partial [Clostridia bacterium]|nr:hypothetical protein [Clostridia bacterium]
SEQDVPEDSEAPSFPDARSGFLPALTQKAGERPDLTDIRVEDNQAAQDEISVRIVDDGGYDPDVPGTYTLLYRAEDPAGNAAEVSRLVTVQSKTAESSAPVSDPPSESSGSGDKGQTENEEADVMIYAAKTPFSRNESGALKYTSSGTSFRTKDRIQIMDSDFFLSEYDACAAGHTNNGGIPFFPNGVLIVADRQYRIRQMRIAAGDLFQIDEKGNVLTDGLTWTNTIDASSGGGLFKGLRDSLSSLIPKGGYLIFCGNYGDQACRRYLIRQFLVSDYESGAIKAGQIDVPKKARTVGWTDKDPGGSGQTDPGGSGQTDPPASAEQRLISAESAMQGFQIYE